MDADKIKQMAGNLSHAAWTGEGATIGGGKFSAAECKAAAIALDAAPAMLAALQELVAWHENPNAPDSIHWLGDVLACHVRPAIAAATGER